MRLPWLISFALVAIAFWFGGWPWATILITALAIARPSSPLPFTALSLFWLAVFYFNDDRRMFFPFSIQLAVQLYALAPLDRPVLAATALVLAFSAIRLQQQATLIVLAVELVVAAVAIAVAAYVYSTGPSTINRRLVAAGLGSLLAFAGLIF